MGQVRRIGSERDYQEVIKRIEALMNKGSVNASKEELAEIRDLALTAQAYEQKQYVVEAPKTLSGMIEWRMFEMRLKQNELAKKLKVSDAKLSLILNGKQKPDIAFLKAVHTELQVDAAFILQHA